MTAKSRNGIKLTSSMRKRRSHRGRIFVTLSGSAIALLLALGVATAQTESSAPARKNNSVYAELAKAPKKAAGRHNPLEADSDAVAAGGKLFAMHCAECHGEMAEGGKKAPSLLADEVQRATPGTLFWLLTNGVVRHGMPVWSKLPEPQRWQLVRFIKSLTSAAQASSNGEKTAHP
jgi:mono/diheme cytochrome c family protein